jgi:hypothetical protein
MQDSERSPLGKFLESQWVGIGVGMIIGAIGSLLSVKWLVGFGWFIVCVEIFRQDFLRRGLARRVIVNLILSGLLGLSLIGIWRFVPKAEEPLTGSAAKKMLNEWGTTYFRQAPSQQAPSQQPPPITSAEKPITRTEFQKVLQQYKPTVESKYPEDWCALSNRDLSEKAAPVISAIEEQASLLMEREREADSYGHSRGTMPMEAGKARGQLEQFLVDQGRNPSIQNLFMEGNRLSDCLLKRLRRPVYGEKPFIPENTNTGKRMGLAAGDLDQMIKQLSPQ